jgi:hypothetical protein
MYFMAVVTSTRGNLLIYSWQKSKRTGIQDYTQFKATYKRVAALWSNLYILMLQHRNLVIPFEAEEERERDR